MFDALEWSVQSHRRCSLITPAFHRHHRAALDVCGVHSVSNPELTASHTLRDPFFRLKMVPSHIANGSSRATLRRTLPGRIELFLCARKARKLDSSVGHLLSRTWLTHRGSLVAAVSRAGRRGRSRSRRWRLVKHVVLGWRGLQKRGRAKAGTLPRCRRVARLMPRGPAVNPRPRAVEPPPPAGHGLTACGAAYLRRLLRARKRPRAVLH